MRSVGRWAVVAAGCVGLAAAGWAAVRPYGQPELQLVTVAVVGEPKSEVRVPNAASTVWTPSADLVVLPGQTRQRIVSLSGYKHGVRVTVKVDPMP